MFRRARGESSPYRWYMAKRSAGLLLYRLSDRGLVKVLIIHPGGPLWARRDDGAWSIPKGEYIESENAHAAAVREFTEELGHAPPEGSETGDIYLGEIRQAGGKRVRAWARRGLFDPSRFTSNTFEMEWPPRSGHIKEFPEVDRAEWFELPVARTKLLGAQGGFLDALQTALDSGDHKSDQRNRGL